MAPPLPEHPQARYLAQLCVATVELVEEMAAGRVTGEQLPPGWTLAHILATERVAAAALDLGQLLGVYDGGYGCYRPAGDPRLAAPGPAYLGLPEGDDLPRCGAPTRTTGGPCRAPVLAPGERCANHQPPATRSSTEREDALTT